MRRGDELRMAGETEVVVGAEVEDRLFATLDADLGALLSEDGPLLLEEALLARKARTISGSGVRDMEGWFAGRARYLLERAMRTSEDVAMAMASRGFDGTLRVMKTGFFRGRDFFCIGLCAFVFFTALLL